MQTSDSAKIQDRLPCIVAESLPEGDERGDGIQSFCRELLEGNQALNEVVLEYASSSDNDWFWVSELHASYKFLFRK